MAHSNLLTRLNALERADQSAGDQTYLVWDELEPAIYHNTKTGEDLTQAQARELQTKTAVTIIRIVYDETPLQDGA